MTTIAGAFEGLFSAFKTACKDSDRNESLQTGLHW